MSSTLNDKGMRGQIGYDVICEAEFVGDLCQSIRERCKDNGISIDDNAVAMPTRLAAGQKDYRVITRLAQDGIGLAVGRLAYELTITLAALPLKMSKRAGGDIINSVLIKARKKMQGGLRTCKMAGHILIVDHEVGIVKGSDRPGNKSSGYFSFYESWEDKKKKECRRLYLSRDFTRLGIERVNRSPGSYRDLWAMYKDAGSKFWQVMRLALSERGLCINERMLMAKAAIYYLGFAYIESRMIESRVKDICSRENEIRYIVTTIEGHPYERMISKWARGSGRVHIGYVNTPFVKYQHAVLMSDIGDLPKVLVMNSAIDHMRVCSHLAKLDNIVSEDVRVVRRCDSCPDLEGVKQMMVKKIRKRDRMRVLVVPNGTMKEVKRLLRKTFECLSVIPELEVTIRFHPLIKRKAEATAEKMLKKQKFQSRVVISEQVSLEECIDQSDCVLYISSSAAVKGLFRGAVPINCGTRYERDLDPLYFSNKEFDRDSSAIDLLKQVMQMKRTRNERMILEIIGQYKALWEGETPMDNEELAELCGL